MATTAELLLHAKLRNEVSRPLKEIAADLGRVKGEIAATAKPTSEHSAKMRQLASETRRAVAQQKELAAKVQQAGRAATMYVSVPIVAALSYSVKAASDLNEAVTKTDAVFGSAAASVHKMAETSARDLGLSKRAAEDAAGSIGALVVPMGLSQTAAADMSIRLVQLSADLASFYNSSGDEALTALRAGLVGEAEPMRRFSTQLSEARVKAVALELGLVGVGEELSDQAKLLARYEIILRDTKIAQGDFERTGGGVAGSLRSSQAAAENAAAALGESLLPVVADLLQMAAALAQSFADLPGPVRTAVVALLGIAAVVGPVTLLIGKLMLMRTQLVQNRAAAAALGATMGTSMAMAGKLFTAATVATVGVSYFKNKRSSGASSWVDERIGEVNPMDQASIRGALLRAQDELARQEQREGKGRIGWGGNFGFWATNGDADRDARIGELRSRVTELTDAERALVAADQAVKDAMGDTGPFDDSASAVDALGDALKDADAAYQTFVGRFLGADAAQIAFVKQMASFREGLNDGWDLDDQAELIDLVEKAYAQAAAEAEAQLIKPEHVGQRSVDLLAELNGTLVPEAQSQLDGYMGRLGELSAMLVTTTIVVEADTRPAATALDLFYAKYNVSGLPGLPGGVPGASTAASRPATPGYPGYVGGAGVRFGDTATPRGHDGAFAGTMAAHLALSTGLGVGPHITNAFVGGFPGSDHHAGLALDLQGPNLGAYARRLVAAGGFAEMHGSGPGRHLHAVYGDTATPRRGMGGSGGGDTMVLHVDARGAQLGPAQIRAITREELERAERERRRRS